MKLSRILVAIAVVVYLTSTSHDAKACLPSPEREPDAVKNIAVITGHGPLLPDEYVVSLFKYEDDGTAHIVATDSIANNQFRFELPVEDGLSVYSFMFNCPALPNTNHKLYVTPGAQIEIDAVDNYSFTWPVKSNVPEQAEYELYTNNIKELWRERQRATLEYKKKRNKEAKQTLDSINRLIDLRDIEFLRTRPVGKIWLDKASHIAKWSDYYKIDTEQLKSMYIALEDSIKNSQIGRRIHGYLYPGSPIGIGDQFPDTEFYDLDGNVHNFSEFKGKWCLVDFWSSACAPSVWAIPELRELKEKYPENFEVISLSIDSDESWHQSSEELHLTGNNWNEGKEDYGIFRRLGLTGFPTFFVVTPDGTIKDLWLGFSEGSLKRGVGFYLRPKGTTEYAESDGLRSVQFPQYESNKTTRVLDIDRIEISNEGTKVFFAFIHSSDKWIRIAPDAYINDSTGKQYKVINSDGIVLGEHLYPDSEGNGSFSITFEKIPETVTTIDFHESSSNDGWSIEGIVLKP